MSGNKLKTQNSKLKIAAQNLRFLVFSFSFALCALRFAFILAVSCQLSVVNCFAQEIKRPNVAGTFYPSDPAGLSQTIDKFLETANPKEVEGKIFALISPHAGYGYSGQVASYGYRLIKDKPYKTVVVIGPAHFFGFSGVSIYPEGVFRTPLGDLNIDKEFAQKLLYREKDIFFEPRAFDKEHSVEVQLPFLQKVLTDFKIVPILMGDSTFATCQKLAHLLKETIGKREDVLVVVSTDMYHGYDYREAEAIDNMTLSCLVNMDAEKLYYGLREGKFQLCGGFAVVPTIMLAKELGHNKLIVLNYTNSARATAKMVKGVWTVGYASCVIDIETPKSWNNASEKTDIHGKEKEEEAMLNSAQRKRLLEIARSSIETYLNTGNKLEVNETDPVLLKTMGAFVTLHNQGKLRGCIGNIVGTQSLYLTVRDMAVEAAVGDPRFPAVSESELKGIDIEISALSPLEEVDSADKIQAGVHGVLVKRGFRSGVFLPQVATDTGWSKEEFLSQLCAQKAGLPADAWKDKATQLFVFTAEVFSEGNH